MRGERLTVYGDGNQTRSLCYVDDTVDALLRMARMPDLRDGVIPLCNVGNPDERTILSVALDVLSFVAKGAVDDALARIDFRPLPADDPRQRRPNIDRARVLLHWEPMVDYADGLARTVEWFRGSTASPAAAASRLARTA